MSYQRHSGHERWNRLKSIRVGLAALRQSFPPISERRPDASCYSNDLGGHQNEWEDADERLENIQRKLHCGPLPVKREADSAVATVNDLHSATLYDSDGLASPIGIGQETACAWFEQYKYPEVDAEAQPSDAPPTPLLHCPPAPPCPSPPTPPPAPLEQTWEQSFSERCKQDLHDLQTCTASNWATQLLGEYAENINECHGDAPDAEENFQSEEVQTSQTSQTSQPSAIPSTPSAASAPLRRPSRPITAPMTPVTRPPFRCGMGLSSSRKRPCSAGRLKGYRSTCSTATPEELQLNGQGVGPAGSASAFCPSERGTHNGEYGEGCRDDDPSATQTCTGPAKANQANRKSRELLRERSGSLSTLLGRKSLEKENRKEPPAENMWHSIEVKVFLRRADLEDLFGLLREEYADLSMPRLLAVPDQELWKLKARRLSVKRLVEAIGMERKRRYPSPVLAPDEPPSPEADPMRTSTLSSRCESASKMVERLLPQEMVTPITPQASPATPQAGTPECNVQATVEDETAEVRADAGSVNAVFDRRTGRVDDARRSTTPRRLWTRTPESTPRVTTPRMSRQNEDGRDSDTSCRPHTRRARIHELLKRLNLAQTPCLADVARVDARQRQAKERHLRLAGNSSSTSTGALSPALSLRHSRSFMDLIGTAADASYPSRTAPIDPSAVENVISRLPAKVATARGEPCTICLEMPSSGEMVTTLPCCHWYHTECIREWLLHARVCPLCKAPVMPEELGI